MLKVLSVFPVSSSISKMSRLDRIAWTVVSLLSVVTVFNLYISMLGNVPHDELIYLSSYSQKLLEEGRWIIFILFDVLRTIPPVISVSLCNVFLFIFAYKVGRASNVDTWCAIIFGLLALNIPHFTMLFKWSMTILPASIILAILALGHQRYARYQFTLIAGILMFATYPGFYFLVPLLFIRQLDQENWSSFVKFISVWILGYVLGYAFAQLFVYTVTTLFTESPMFFHIAEWRNPKPMTDLSSMLENITRSTEEFKMNLQYLSELSPWFYVPIVGVFIWALKSHLKFNIINILVVFSVYASVVLIGIDVPLRTGITLPLGIAVIALLVKQPLARVLLLVSIFIPFSYNTYSYNYAYNKDREIIANFLEQSDNYNYLKQPNKFKKIVITLDENKTSEYLFYMTKNDEFKKIWGMKNKYIKPHFKQYGWKHSDIVFNNVLYDELTENTHLKVKDDIIYLYVR